MHVSYLIMLRSTHGTTETRSKGLSQKYGAAQIILNLQVNSNLQNLNMSRGVSDKITYKPYNQGEQWLLPPSLNELVPQNHFVRIVSKTVTTETATQRQTKMHLS